MKKAIKILSIITALMAILMFMGCSSSSSVAEEESDVGFYGQVVDGPIKNILVFVDTDGDGELGDDEAMTYTNKNGNFKITGKKGKFKKGDIIIALGSPDAIDISTGLSINITLKSKILAIPTEDPAATPTVVISPATTFAIEMGENWNATVQQNMGISADIDIFTYNPLIITNDPNATPAQKQAAVSVQQFNIKMVNLIETTTSLFIGSIDDDSKSNKDLTKSAKSAKKKKAKKDLSKVVFFEISKEVVKPGFSIASFGSVDTINSFIVNVENNVSTNAILTINPTKLADVQVNVVNTIITVNNHLDTIVTSGTTTTEMMTSLAGVAILVDKKSALIVTVTSSGSMEDIDSLTIIDISKEVNTIIETSTNININISVSPADDDLDTPDITGGTSA